LKSLDFLQGWPAAAEPYFTRVQGGIMKRLVKGVLLLAIAAGLTAVPAAAQIKLELTGFGGFGFNLGNAKTVTIDSDFADDTAFFYDCWQTMWSDPVLELKGGLGFGGRLTLWFTPMIGVEGGFEYSMMKPRINADAVAAVEAQMDDIGYLDYITIVPDAGHVTRIYGSLVLNMAPGAPFSPYLAIGAGVNSYAMGPSIIGDRPNYLEYMSFRYENSSALCLNGGMGFKFWVAPRIGLVFDGRVFFTPSAEFKQLYRYKFFGVEAFPEDNYVTQSGSSIDVSVSAGIVIRLM
jgi:hypothetical protein